MGNYLSLYKNLNDFDNINRVESKDKQSDQNSVSQKQNKLLSVEKPYATPEPRTVMIHAQNTLLATGTVMTSLWLETMANHAVSFFPHFRLVHVKAL